MYNLQLYQWIEALWLQQKSFEVPQNLKLLYIMGFIFIINRTNYLCKQIRFNETNKIVNNKIFVHAVCMNGHVICVFGCVVWTEIVSETKTH